MPKIIDLELHKNIHAGRREKLRELFINHGLTPFNATQVLEYALGTVIPRIDTNPIAHNLINTFGSLEAVLEAHPDKLQEIKGVGPQASVFLSFLRQFVTYYTIQKQETTSLKNHQEAVEYLAPIMQTFSIEEFMLLCLDKNCNIQLQKQISGTLSQVDINIRNVVDEILRVKVNSVIFAHNHIDGSVNPSTSDIAFTRTMVNVLAPLEINVADHLIFAKGDESKVFSFAETKVGKFSLLELFKKEQKSFLQSRGWEKHLE